MDKKLKIENYLKMKNDVVFKAFFTRKENEGFLKNMLEAILEQKIQIKRVFHDVRLEQLTREQKYGTLDLGIELEDKTYVNVEIQLKDYFNIEERSTFYAGKKVAEMLNVSEKYEEMGKVIIIAILNYSFIDLPEYFTETVRVATKHREYEINNNVKYYYIELDKFRKQKPNMKEALNQWLAFLDMERGDLLEMAKKESKEIKKALNNYEVLTGDAAVKRLAEIRFMEELDKKSAFAIAESKGIAKRKRRRKKRTVLQKEKQNGMAKGEKAKQLEIAKTLIAKGFEKNEIAEITKLSIEEIEELEKEQ